MARWLVRELAEQRGITRYRLAKDSGLAPYTVTLIWNNQAKRLDLDTLTALARVLGVEPQELIGSEDDKEGQQKAVIDAHRQAQTSITAGSLI